MPERRLVIVEGPADRATLVALERAGVLPGLEPREASGGEVGGKSGLAARALQHAIGGLGVVVLRDRDERDLPSVRSSFANELSIEAENRAIRVAMVADVWVLPDAAPGGVALVVTGSGAERIGGFDLSSRMLDDFLLQLLVDSPKTLAALSDAAVRDHALAFRKLRELHEILEGQGVKVQSSKRLLQLLRGITGFPASAATYADRVINKAAALDREALERVYEPLCQDLREAVQALECQPARDV